MYKLFCMHPVVGRGKEAVPRTIDHHTITHPRVSLTFAIFSSLSTLCKITPPYSACLRKGRASVMLSTATLSLWPTSRMQFADHIQVLTTVRLYAEAAIVKKKKEREKRREKNRSSQACGKKGEEHPLFLFFLSFVLRPRHFPSRN